MPKVGRMRPNALAAQALGRFVVVGSGVELLPELLEILEKRKPSGSTARAKAA